MKRRPCYVCQEFDTKIVHAETQGRTDAAGWWRDAQVLHLRYGDQHRPVRNEEKGRVG